MGRFMRSSIVVILRQTLGNRPITDSTSFCAAALEVGHVNLVQGSAFGMEGFARLSFATSEK